MIYFILVLKLPSLSISNWYSRYEADMTASLIFLLCMLNVKDAISIVGRTLID